MQYSVAGKIIQCDQLQCRDVYFRLSNSEFDHRDKQCEDVPVRKSLASQLADRSIVCIFHQDSTPMAWRYRKFEQNTHSTAM